MSVEVEIKINARRMVEAYAKKAKVLVTAAAQETRNEAVLSIQRGPKTGRTYKKYNPKRTHTASAAGQAPASDTGMLASRIEIKNITGLEATVGTDVGYGRSLEFGTRKMAPRPFLKPAAEKGRKKLQSLIKRGNI